MAAKPLTKAEKAWLKKLQDVFNECPSKRLAAYTIGDNDLTIYDSTFDDAIHAAQDRGGVDFGPACDKLGAKLETIYAPFMVHSVAS